MTVDIRAEMLSVAKDMAAENTGSTTESEGALEAASDTAEAEDGAPESTEEAGEGVSEGSEDDEEAYEAKAEDDEESAEKKEAKDEKKDEKKKSSSYARLQKRLELKDAEAKRARKEAAEGLVLANQWRNRTIVLAREVEKMKRSLAERGVRRDPRDDRLLAHEMRELDRETAGAGTEHLSKAEEQAHIDNIASQMTEEASDLEAKYKGQVKQGEILRAYAAMIESSKGEEDVSMEEVANLLYARKTKARGPQTQLQKNRSAVRPIKTQTTARPPDFKANTTDMHSFLRSQGLA